MFFLSFIFPIIGYLFSVYPRFYNRYFGVDVWTRMIESQLVRQDGHKIPTKKITNGFLIPGHFDYPPVFPLLLSFFEPRKLLKIQGFISPLFDSLLNLSLFFIAYHFSQSVPASLLAQAIYTFSPLATLENSYLTPRSFGYMLFTLSFFPLIFYSINPQSIYLVLSLIFSVLTFLSHRFATQSLLFICLFFSVIEFTPLYISMFLLSLLLATIITKGYYLKVLSGHLFNIQFWVNNRVYRFAHQVRGVTKNKHKRDFVSFMYYILGTFTPVTLTGTNLWLFFPFALLTDKVLGLNIITYSDPFLIKLVIWVMFFYLLAVAVLSIEYLIPIGEGQRYLEMALGATAVASALIITSLLTTEHRNLAIAAGLIILTTNIGLTVFSQREGIIKDKNRSVRKGMQDVFNFLNSQNIPLRILCVPHQITTLILYNTRFTNNSNVSVLVNAENKGLLDLKDVYPILKQTPSELAKKHKLNILILKTDFVTPKELKLSRKDLVLSIEDTKIYWIGDSKERKKLIF